MLAGPTRSRVLEDLADIAARRAPQLKAKARCSSDIARESTSRKPNVRGFSERSHLTRLLISLRYTARGEHRLTC